MSSDQKRVAKPLHVLVSSQTLGALCALGDVGRGEVVRMTESNVLPIEWDEGSELKVRCIENKCLLFLAFLHLGTEIPPLYRDTTSLPSLHVH